MSASSSGSMPSIAARRVTVPWLSASIHAASGPARGEAGRAAAGSRRRFHTRATTPRCSRAGAARPGQGQCVGELARPQGVLTDELALREDEPDRVLGRLVGDVLDDAEDVLPFGSMCGTAAIRTASRRKCVHSIVLGPPPRDDEPFRAPPDWIGATSILSSCPSSIWSLLHTL